MHIIYLGKSFITVIIFLILLATFIPTLSTGDEYQMPVLMYHNITKGPLPTGPYVLSLEQFEKDLIYIKKNNYTTIFVEDLLNYANNGTPLPNKPIMITFDDGHECCFKYVLPLLEKYEMKAVVSIVGNFCDFSTENPTPIVEYSYLNWNEVKLLADSKYFEIQNHTYNLHSTASRLGCKIKKYETIEKYEEVINADIGSLQQKIFEITGKYPDAIAFPFGYYCSESTNILKKLKINVAFTCSEKQINLKNMNLFRLGRFNRPSGISSESYFEKILK